MQDQTSSRNKIHALALTLFAFLGITDPQSIHADGTKQLYCDAGLYSGDPPGSATMDIYTWAATSLSINAQVSTTNAPEGEFVGQATVPTQWGGFGIFNVIPGVAGSTSAADYSDYQGGAIRFWLNSQDELELQIQYNAQDGTPNLKVTQVIEPTGGVWQEIVVPLTNFQSYPQYPEGLCLSQIVGPFLISTSDASGATSASKTWAVDDVRWTKPLASLAVYPSAATLNPGQHRQFTVEGISSNGEPVLVYANFTAPESLGSLTPEGSPLVSSSILLGGQTGGTVGLMATNPPLSASTTATATITHANLQQEFGVLSSTRTNLHLDSDSKLLSFYGGAGANTPLLTNQALGLIAGEPILQTTVNLASAASYAGWTVQLGTNSPTTNTLDMSDYYDGYIRFLFNASNALNGTMTVGIRSGNVAAGTEESSVSLNNFTAFDGQWHKVAIPLRVLAGLRPRADLSRMQDLVTFSVTGNVGVQNFSVEDVRWETGITPSNSGLQITSFAPSGPSNELTLSGPSGLAFSIQASTNLTAWTTIFNGVLGVAPFGFIDTNGVETQALFYRSVGLP